MFNLKITDEDAVAQQGLAREFTSQSAGHYALAVALSALTASAGLVLVAIGLVEITKPLIPMSLGLTLAGLGAVVLFGGLASLQVLLRKRKVWKMQQDRMEQVTHRAAPDSEA